MALTFFQIVKKLIQEYRTQTSAPLKIFDAFLLWQFISGIMMFVYVIVAGNFPFNAFLAAFISAVGFFILTVSVRLKFSSGKQEKNHLINKKEFAEFFVCGVVLFLAVFGYIGKRQE
ncbi:dolichyl-diphosphooligosaccharide--protein glycosyltransferase subunit dad1 [Anaeramoeba ignava]|uniref:Dolichyl-diphosphooligosaccharide--protein glycosyltransferase subunit OST2 n=1 Tax=Anaeramoeba ignava TaxID=1746090 RepID=A0A9Q0LA04_ANAIG|nr:dolichyl-diphosphooligosaccharide--protein glycosyltransferase subunit dad1 [Anaeramoeba ignava]|eukprot:Anaeramoba_ignava/a626231_6.p1 GENE.a626231_6~~a626231_6.p1  ORF type:complete len:117 (-),score=29.73 a626231_6:139-489(-)